MPEALHVTGVVLAGGASRRMGRDKARLPWGNATLIEHVVETLRPIMGELFVVAGNARAFAGLDVRVVEDLVPDAHALGGLYTGLRAASHERCFVCACDTPFVSPAVIRLLIQRSDGYDAAIPRTPEGLQPLHAVYRKSALPAVETQLRRQQFTVATLVERLRVNIVEAGALRRVDPAGLSFLNLNTPQDYLAARAALTCRQAEAPTFNDAYHGMSQRSSAQYVFRPLSP